MPGLHLSVLGGFLLTATAGAAIALPRKCRALLAYLALTAGRAHSRERLAALLWEDSSEAQARTSLRQALTSIRKALPAHEGALLLADAELVALGMQRVALDAAQFEQLVEQGGAEALEQAAALYRGDLLEGFSSGAPAFEDWVRAERERLRGRAREALARLADHHAEQDRLDQAVMAVTRLIALDPLQEQAHRLAMRLYVRQGKAGEALRQYRRCRELLAAELGVPPDAQTEALYRQVLQDRRLRPGGGAETPGDEPADVAAKASTGTPAPSDTAAAPGDARQAPASSAAPQLRDATVMLADLYGFTAFTGQTDPEEVHDYLSRYRAMVNGILTRHGGTLTNYIGARVMAVFGAPMAYGNDSERALRAVLAIRAGARALESAGGQRLVPHIGVASGPLLVSADAAGLTISGEPVSIAARIMETAGPGEIRISDRVRDVLADRIDGQPLPGVAIQAARPLEVWQLAGLRDAATAATARAFVGRSLELRQLEGILDASLASERGHVILVRGEAGIGKSCLVEKLAALAGTRGYAAHKALIFDFGADAATDPIAALTRSLLGIEPGATVEQQREAAARALAAHHLGLESAAHLEHLLALPRAQGAPEEEPGEGGARLRTQQEVLARLIRAQARMRPLLLLVEDVHWADAALLEQLARLAAGLRGSRVVMVMTTRTETDPIDQAWRAACAGCPLTTIDLGPLSEEEALQLADAYRTGDDEFVRSCVRRAEGNPLFLDQLLRISRVERGGLPGSVQSLVLARLDRLPVQDRHALQAAAVLGQRFALPGVRYLVGSPQSDLQALLEQGLIRHDGQDYFFAHALIQEAIYASLLRSMRQELHARAARFFAERDCALHAEHLDAAQDPKAAAAYFNAAQHEAEHYHFQRALHLAERGLALCADAGRADAELGHRLACLRGDLLRDLGQADTSTEVFGAALDAAADDRQRYTALYGLASSLRILDRYAAALEAVDRAEKLGPQVADAAELAELYFLRGNLYFPMGETDACLAAHERARAYALSAGSPLLEARALGSLGDAYYLRGEIQTAYEYFARCVELCRARGLARVEAACLPMLAITQLYRNEVQAGVANAQAGIALARNVGSFRAELLACDVLGSLLRYAAQWQPMRDAGERTLELARRLKARRFEADALAMIALAAHGLGERERAEMLLDQSYGVSLEVGRKYTAAWTLGAVAQVTADERKRNRALKEGEKLLAQGCVSHNYLHFYEAGMEAMLAARNWTEVERYAAALEDYTREQPVAWADFFVRRGRLLAGWGRSPRNAEVWRELQALADYARGCGHVAALAGIEAALA